MIFRVTGKRAPAQITTFDAVLLLIISESIQQAMIDGDESMVNGFLLVVVLVGADIPDAELVPHTGISGARSANRRDGTWP